MLFGELRRGRRALGVLGLGAMASGCGLTSAVADPQAARASRPADEAGAAPAAGTVTAKPPSGPVTLAGVAVTTEDGSTSDHLSVVRRPMQTGLAPPMSGFLEDCTVDPAALQYPSGGPTGGPPCGGCRR